MHPDYDRKQIKEDDVFQHTYVNLECTMIAFYFLNFYKYDVCSTLKLSDTQHKMYVQQ